MDLFIISMLFITAGITLAVLTIGAAKNTNKKLVLALLFFFIGIIGVVVSNFLK